jgi:hypothetical protein
MTEDELVIQRAEYAALCNAVAEFGMAMIDAADTSHITWLAWVALVEKSDAMTVRLGLVEDEAA